MRPFVPALLAVLTIGCSSAGFDGSRPLEEYLERSEIGAPADGIPEHLWIASAAEEEREGDRITFWPLPFVVTRESLTVDDGLVRASYSDLEIVALLLPFWLHAENREYERYGACEWSTFSASPLWASAERSDGMAPEDAFEAFGVPLVYSRIVIPSEGVRLTCHNVLWTLGPFFLSNPGEGYLFVPLLAAGYGPLAWISTSSAELEMHGPLYGLLGYLDVSQVDEDLRLVLGGSLWFSRRRDAGEDGPARSVRGPLWTLFGAGSDDEGPFVRLFGWIDWHYGDPPAPPPEPLPTSG